MANLNTLIFSRGLLLVSDRLVSRCTEGLLSRNQGIKNGVRILLGLILVIDI